MEFYDSPQTVLKIGSENINGMAVLRKGNSGWGWEHIVERTHHIEIRNAFGLADNQKAVQDFIGKGLRNGLRNGDEIIWEIPNKTKKLKIVVGHDLDKLGAIISAYPI